MKSTLKVLSAFVFSIIFLASCSKSDDVKPKDIAGTWDIQSAEGTSKKIGETTTSKMSQDDISDLSFLSTSSFTFGSDGKFTMLDQSKDTYKGTYTISGSKLMLTFDDMAASKIDISYTIDVSGSSMKLSSSLETIIGFLDSAKKSSTDKSEQDTIEFFKTILRGTFTEFTIIETYKKK